MFLEISHNLPILCLLVASTSASINVRQSGWLDRVVRYHKSNFIKDAQMLPAVEIHARIEKASPGFKDSKNWDFESVMRLLGLLRQSETGREVHRALRRSMMAQPNRRIYMSFMDTFKYFPRIHHDNYYLDSGMESLELVFDTTPHSKILDDSDVIIVSNPVEARLPSTKISVKMLRAILEERALAARIMPPTTKAPIDWKPMNKSKTKDKTGGNGTKSGNDTATDGETTTGASDGNSTASPGASESGATGGAASDTASGETATTEAGATTEEAAGGTNTTGAPPAARRHVKKGKPALRKNKPAARKSSMPASQKSNKPVPRVRMEPRPNRPNLRKKAQRGTKKPSRKSALQKHLARWGR